MNKVFALVLSVLVVVVVQAQNDSSRKWKDRFPFKTLDKIQHGNLKFVPVPVFTISPERGASMGVVLNYFFKAAKKEKDTATRASHTYLNLQYSTRRQFVAEVGYSVYTNAEKYYLQGGFGYKDFYERYWTLSDFASKNNEYLGMQYSQLFLKGRVLKNLGKQSFVGLSYYVNSMNNIAYENKPIPLTPTFVPGFKSSCVVGIGPAISIDKRDNQFSPQKGWYAEGSFRFHEKWMGSDYSYNQLNIDLRKYIPVKPKGILALNTVATVTNGNVPLLEKQRLGSDKIMRGYFTGRFRDNQFIASQMEYRYPLGKSFVMAAFVSAGQTAETVEKMEWQYMQTSVGGGLRYLVNKDKKIYIRIDAGYTRLKNMGFYFSLGDAF